MSRADDPYYPGPYPTKKSREEKITLADVAKIILGSIITIGGFYSLTIILFTL